MSSHSPSAVPRAVLDSVDLGIVTADARGRVVYHNRAASEFLGIDDSDRFDLFSALSLAGPLESLVGTTRDLLLNRREVEVRVSDCDGDFMLLLRDVTNEHAMQHEMRRVERLAAMGTMVSGFAHEVRNPVASLRTMAESLDEELGEAGLQLPHVRRMLTVLARIERLVSTSLQFGRPASPRRAAVRPWAIISTALATVLPRTRVLGGEIRVEIEPDLPSVLVDEGQLVQVVVILMNNALDATQSPRQVTARALLSPTTSERGRSRPPPATVRFELVDEGPGVPREVQSRMFDPFFTTKPTGTGLGLSIAQQIVSENGARLWLESAHTPTAFVVECPISI